MYRTNTAKPLPQDLAALLEQTRQDVERYRRLHPEWQPRPPTPPKPNAQ